MLLKCAWLKGGVTIFALDLDDAYDDSKRRQSSASKSQGQLRDVLEVLPEGLRQQYKDGWIGRAVRDP